MSLAMVAEVPILKRVATYERVSSEDQKERETIKMQSEELARRLGLDPTRHLVKRYIDDGCTSRIPLAKRPAGSALMADAELGLFDEVWVYKLDRLARLIRDTVTVREELEELGVTVCSATQHVTDRFSYNIHAVLGDQELVTMRDRLVGGARTCAADGFYVGGVVPYGYRPQPSGRRTVIVPSDIIIWGDLTEAAVVRKAYARVGIDGWSCRRVVEEFNEFGIPTAEKRPGLGRRKTRTQGLWRASRLRNMLVNTTYKGDLLYGRRNTKSAGQRQKKDIIHAHVEPLVSEELWQAAQEALTRNRVCTKNTTRIYPLRSVMICGFCGLTYVGTTNHGDTWYRCNGYLRDRGPIEGRCPSKAVKGETLEPQIWADVEAFLRNPGDLLRELATEVEDDVGAKAEREQRDTLQAGLEDLDLQRTRLLDLAQSGLVQKDELRERLDELATKRTALKERLSALEPPSEAPEDPGALDTLQRLCARLDEGLTEEEQAEIIRILVPRIVIHTEPTDDGKKQVRAVVEYRFPQPTEGHVCVVSSCTGKGSSHPRE